MMQDELENQGTVASGSGARGRRKTLLVVASVVVVAALALGGTFAYLQSKSVPVVNTFSDNEVTAKLVETTGESYDILPGTVQDKDPKVIVSATTPAYAYVEVKDNTQNLVSYSLDNAWQQLDGYENVYYQSVSGGTQSDASPLEYMLPVLNGNQVSYSATLTNETIKAGKNAANTADSENGLNLTFTAYAIQAKPFNDPVKAWLATAPETVTTADGLKAALAAGKSVILGADVTVTEQLVVSGATAVLDLNGHTIKNESDLWNTSTDSWSLISVQNKGDLLITGTGTLQAKKDDCYAADVRDGSKLTIAGGKFVGNIHAVYVFEGSLEITGGEFSIQQLYPNANKSYDFEINLYDANRKTGAAKATITGGKFYKFDPSNNQSEGSGTNYVASGHTVTEDGDYYIVK